MIADYAPKERGKGAKRRRRVRNKDGFSVISLEKSRADSGIEGKLNVNVSLGPLYVLIV